MLAKALAERGHEVTWWISDFVHRSKTYRASGIINDPLLPPGVRVIGVHSTPYARNISWQRIQYEKNYGIELVRLAENESMPDMIVMGDPALFFSRSILDYKEKIKCKLVLDVIDLWPELFTVALPKWLKPLSQLLFMPLYKRRRALVNACDGVVAVSRDYLSAALFGQTKEMPNSVVYWGIDIDDYDTAEVNCKLDCELFEFRKKFKLTLIYAGTLGDAYDMNIIIAAIKRANKQNLPVGFIIAGDGPRKQDFVQMTEQYASNLKFLGALPATDIATIYRNGDVGLMTYVPGSTVAMPIKFFDYLAGGLVILNSLERDVREIMAATEIGLNYRPADLDDFMKNVEKLASDEDGLSRLKRNSRKLVENYHTKHQYNGFVDFVERV